MIRTAKLKIWTLISHACIVIGIGHGISTLGIMAPFWLISVFSGTYNSVGDSDVSSSTIQLVALMALFGQFALVLSLFLRSSSTALWVHLIGLWLLWSAIGTYAIGVRDDNYAHLSVITCIPFAYFTLVTFFGRRIQILWQRLTKI